MLSALFSHIYTYYYLFSIYIYIYIYMLGVCLPAYDVSFLIDHYNLSLVITTLPVGWWIGMGSSTNIFILSRQDPIQL